MDKHCIIIVFILSFLGLRSQEFYIFFRPAENGTLIDSTLVTNLRTNQKVWLAPGDSLFLTQSSTGTTTTFLGYTAEELYPNPCSGEAWLRFYTSGEEPVLVAVYNTSGQLLKEDIRNLPPGSHRYRMNFPYAGIFFISVFKDGRITGFKAVSVNNTSGAFTISHAESKKVNFSDSAALFKRVEKQKTMHYSTGDILYCSVFSGRNTTILTVSPAERTVYPVEFRPCLDAGNTAYPVVKTGNQWWMARNLAWLPSITSLAIGSETSPCYYVYGYDGGSEAEARRSSGFMTYGVLYNWTAAMGGAAGLGGHQRGVRGACPPGWHVPADTEWNELTAFLGGANTAGSALKATGTRFWESPNTGASNRSGFTALPGGARMNDKSFSGAGMNAIFWSSTGYTLPDASYKILNNQNTVFGALTGSKANGYSIRCIIDIPVTPLVITDQAAGITQSAALCGGAVTHDGFLDVTERGIVYAEKENPLLSDNKVLMGTGTGNFSGTVTELKANTRYFIRAYAINGQGVAYGEQVSFTTKPELTLPVVTTAPVSVFTQIMATGGGTVTSDGNSPVTARGICWNTAGTPDITGNKTLSGSGTGSFTGLLTGLLPGTTYYVRAFATNSVGTAYGETVSFTTSPEVTLPAVTTANADSITARSVILGGNVTHDGYSAITERGVVYGTAGNPSLNGQKVSAGSGTGPFSIKISGLEPKTDYYFQAYAINNAGIAFGNIVSFTTSCPAVDADGNCYNSVFIGNQEWMAENLRTTRYRDGTPVAMISDNDQWTGLTSGAFTWYGNDENNKTVYGALYNWYAAVDAHKLCPAGWHLPDDTEWAELITFLGGEWVAGGKMKEAGTSHWNNPNTGATNSSGFTALPAGIRGGFGSFYNVGNLTYWWSSTSATASNAFVRGLFHDAEDAAGIPYPKSFGLSVRCVRDK